ncbi:MAG: hypothetical protein SGPRY_005105 [Prymnesium sp.]
MQEQETTRLRAKVISLEQARTPSRAVVVSRALLHVCSQDVRSMGSAVLSSDEREAKAMQQAEKVEKELVALREELNSVQCVAIEEAEATEVVDAVWRGQVAALDEEVASLHGEIASLRGEVAALQGEVDSFKQATAAQGRVKEVRFKWVDAVRSSKEEMEWVGTRVGQALRVAMEER